MKILEKLVEKQKESNNKIKENLKKCSNNEDDKIGEFSINDKKKEIKELNNLLYDETCNYIISGYSFKSNQIIAITSRRIIFLHKGLKSQMKMQDIYIDDIKYLKIEKGIAFGKMEISLENDDIVIGNIGKKFIEDAANFINKVKIDKIMDENNNSYKDAKIMLENDYRIFNNIKIKRDTEIKKQEKEKRENERLRILSEQAIQKQKEEKYERERVSQLKREHIPYCPKCHSTSLTYQNKKLSVGRAVVGGVIMGPIGTAVGGVTSKKGYVKCLNCGHKWKL